MGSWQDIVLSLCVLVFNLALIPSVMGKQKPRFVTSVITCLAVLPQILVFASLKLWYSLAMASINASLWAVLVVQANKRVK